MPKAKVLYVKKRRDDAEAAFQLVKDKYKELIGMHGIDEAIKKRAEKRLSKLKNPDWKYSPTKLTK